MKPVIPAQPDPPVRMYPLWADDVETGGPDADLRRFRSCLCSQVNPARIRSATFA
jgi:hypothetical protein